MTGSSLLLDDRTFQALVARALSARELALDCEFHAERRYRPTLYLVQLNVAGEVAAVDPTRIDLSPLRDLLERDDVRKIVHAGREDLRLLTHATGATDIANVWDTQVIAGFLGHGPAIGYARLVKQLLGHDIDKSQQFTDWSSGLTAEQVNYALDDVRHLPPVAALLEEELVRRGRLRWALEASRTMTLAALAKPDLRHLYRKIHGSARLGSGELGVLRELAIWREDVAERENCRPEAVVNDAGLKQLALRPPTTYAELRKARGVALGGAERHWSSLREAMDRGGAAPEPALVVTESDARVEVLVLFLSAVRRAVGIELDVAPDLLAATSELRELAEWHLQGRAVALPALPVLSGWRHDHVGVRLLEVLAGTLAARVEPAAPSGLAFVATGT